MEEDYYERYWKEEIGDGKGHATRPPEHESQDLERLISVVNPYMKGKILDVGCGEGTITNVISGLEQAQEVSGIDISPTAISIAKSKYPRIDFKTSPATNLPFDSESLDTILAIEVVEHIYDTEQMFKEFSRVLKVRGCLIVSTTDFNFLKKIMIALFFWDKYFYPTNPHVRFFTKKSLSSIMRQWGLKIEEYRWNGSYSVLMPKGQIVVARKTASSDRSPNYSN